MTHICKAEILLFHLMHFIWCIFHAWVMKINLKKRYQKVIWRTVSECQRENHISRKSIFSLSYDTSISKDELGITKICLFKCLHFHKICIKQIPFHWLAGCLPKQQTELTKDLTPFRWWSAKDKKRFWISGFFHQDYIWFHSHQKSNTRHRPKASVSLYRRLFHWDYVWLH